jgi:class 3 adenylate cyclase/pimeloyl-ACP methyl ester carboxylesterase
MRRPEVDFVRAVDGTYLAYQTFGVGPVDIFWQADTFSIVDQIWDSPVERAWYEGLADFARVTIYDRRGLGLSSRNVALGNLETQVEDILTVLDAQGIDRVVLGGALEGGAPNALFAATHPGRVHSLVWLTPLPRTTATDDFPWGVDQDYIERDQEMTQRWGTSRWAREFIESNLDMAGTAWGTEDYIGFLAASSRRTCTPDVAAELARMWIETDVRGILPSIQAKTLLLTDTETAFFAVAESVAEKIPRAEVLAFPGLDSEIAGFAPIQAAIRRFVGAERAAVGLDSTLATVMFTDIVNSTNQQAAFGDHAWNQVIEAHHAIVRAALVRWRGQENDTAGDGFYATFDGPARAVRCALEIIARIRDLGIEVRGGVHTGECDVVGGKFVGIAVTTGARIAAAAAASQVLVSQTVKDLVAGSGLAFQPIGEYELKGVPDRFFLYAAID